MWPRPVPVLLAAVVLAGAALDAQTPNRIAQEIDTARVRALPNHLPRWANPDNGAGLVPPGQAMGQLTMVLSRSPEREAAFEKLLADQQDPASPDYHRWLTPTQVGERFGLSAQDIGSLTGWLQSQGLHVDWVSPSGVFMGFGGTAANLNGAFQTELRYYRVNGARRFSVSSDPLIPEALAPAIKAIRGLYTLDEHPLDSGTVARRPSFEDPGVGHLIAPADFATIYDLPTNLTGAGVTIGIPACSRTNFADFANFRRLTGSTFPNPTEVVPAAFGGADPGPALTTPLPPDYTPPCPQSGATVEVERAGSVAPGANLVLVANSGDAGPDVQYLVNTTPVVQVISIGFASCESSSGASGVSFWDTLFQQAAAEGISVFAGSGDAGAAGCDLLYGVIPASTLPNSPNVLCSSSYVTCVGGTEFNYGGNPSLYWKASNGTGLLSAIGYVPEGGWNDSWNGSGGVLAASGGGVSAFIHTPGWQTGTGVPAQRYGRYTPDVSFAASGNDAYLVCETDAGATCADPGYAGTGSGTAAAAADMAGVAALLDQQLGTLGNLNPALYQMAASVPAAFHDVTVATSGVTNCSAGIPSMCNNSLPGQNGAAYGQTGYVVGPGFDQATGLGSLDVQTLAANYPGTPRPARLALSAPSLEFPGTPVRAASTPQILGFSNTLTGQLSPPAISFTGTNAGDFSQTNSCQPPGYNGGACSIQVVFIPQGVGNRTAVLEIAVANASNSPQTVLLTGTATGGQPPTVKLSLYLNTVTTSQAIPGIVWVYGTGGYAPPAGTVTLSYGTSYKAQPVTLGNGSASLTIPAGSLPIGTGDVTATYTPDAASASIYGSASGTATITVTPSAPAITTPSVTVTTLVPVVTALQNLQVTVAVSGGNGNPTPTGFVGIISGRYSSGNLTLANGTATAGIPPGALAIGSDTLYATYTPDSASSGTYTGSLGSIQVTVTAQGTIVPTVTVTPFPWIVTTTQGVWVAIGVGSGNNYPAPTGTVTVASGTYAPPPLSLIAGGAVIGIPAGSLAPGTDKITVTYAPDDASAPMFAGSTGVGSVSVIVNPSGGGTNALSVNPGGVVNSGSYTEPVAPGSIATVFGNFLLTASVQASFPSTYSLGGLSLGFGNGSFAPLYFASSAQATAQIPWELTGLSQTTISASMNAQVSAPVTVKLATYAPGIYAMNGAGTGQGAITDVYYRVVDSTNPTSVGSVVTIYCTGLGPVTNQPATGAPSPSSPLAWTGVIPTVTIGGVQASTLFYGLTPGSVGLYQLNVQVPPIAVKGSAVPVAIAIAGIPSNTVTMAVQ
jgi:uncharacterized protein (TIGR03437 family)